MSAKSEVMKAALSGFSFKKAQKKHEAAARKLQPYVGKLMRHTEKALRKGCPADRIFAVVGVASDQGQTYLLAWKCDWRPDGRIGHPAYKRPMEPFDKRLFITGKAANGSTPTALFKPDSFYRVVSTNLQAGRI